MARPGGTGVSYFPLDCYMDDDVKLIQAEYGLPGFALVVKLYQKIYGGLGYYCGWDKDVGLLFAQENGVGYNLVSEIVRACLVRGIFNSDLFRQYGILTSHGIQCRYLKMVSRRVGEKIKEEYALVKCAQNENMYEETPFLYAETPFLYAETDESKVKESKVNNTLSIYAHARGKNKNVMLTDEEYADLVQRIPVADEFIDHFSDKLKSRGYRYDSHYKAILEWWASDGSRFLQKAKDPPKERKKKPFEPTLGNSFDTDDFFQAALEKSMRGLQLRRDD